MTTAAAAASATAAIDAQGVSLERGGSAVLEVPAWFLPQGEHVLIRGASGSGKTTLLHLVAGLEPVGTGTIRVLGTPVSELDHRARDRFRARNIGLVFQDFHLLTGLTVEENLRLPLWFSGCSIGADEIGNLLDRLGIDGLLRRHPHQLSQGEKQRVAIARAVVHRPRLILADEPTSALDDRNAEGVLDLLRAEARASGASLVTASHDSRLKSHFEYHLALEAPS